MEDNPDSLVNQEVLTPGQLFLMFLKVGALPSPAVDLCSGVTAPTGRLLPCGFSGQFTAALCSTSVCWFT